MTGVLQRFRRVRDDDDGATALEFAIVAPLFFALIFSFFDVGILMLRDALLSHAVDKSIREVRIDGDVTVAEFTDRVCERAYLLPDCRDTLVVDLRKVGGRAVTLPTAGAPCVDPVDPVLRPHTQFQPNDPGEIMFMRVCAVSAPIVTTSFLGYNFARRLAAGNQDGMARIVVNTAFMGE